MVYLHPLLQLCTGFVWERVNFVHSKLWSVLFWVWGERGWKHRGDLVLAEPCLHSVRAFSALPSAPTMRKLGKDTGRTADPNWPKGDPSTTQDHAQKGLAGKEEGGGGILSDGICFSMWLLCVTEPCCSGYGWWEVVNYFLILFCLWTAFAFPSKLFLSQPMRFCPFTLPMRFPIPQWLCGAELGLNHKKLVDHNGHWPLLTLWRSIYTGSPELLRLQ